MTARAEAFAASAEALIGAPFRLHGRSPDTGVDCVGLVDHALRALGVKPPPLPPYNMRNTAYEYAPRLAQLCGFEAARGNVIRGDLVAIRPGPGQLHLLVTSGRDSFVHAHAGLRRVVAMIGPIGSPILHHLRFSEKN